jgi:nitrate reductase gamma subunit
VVLALFLAAGGLVERATGTPLSGGAPMWTFVHRLTGLIAWVGLSAAAIGTLGLLVKRLTDPKLRGYTSPAARLNLLFMLAAFGVGIAARATSDPGCELLRARVGALLAFSPAAGTPTLVSLELALFAVFAAYMPLTFMSHMYMKFFTYHLVRWDDHPRRPGDPTDPRLAEALKFPVSWSAPHIQGDGKKTWADVVTADGLPKQEGADK